MTVEYRNITSDTRLVGYGTIGARVIEPDGLVQVQDEAAESYDHQRGIWKPVDEAAWAARNPRSLFSYVHGGGVRGHVDELAPTPAAPAAEAPVQSVSASGLTASPVVTHTEGP